MTDQGTICIEGLKVEATIGVFDWERQIRQPLHFDFEIDVPIQQAGRSDELVDTLDYAAFSDFVCAFVEASEFQLLEALSARLGETLCAEFSFRRLRMKISKPDAVPRAQNIALIQEWDGSSHV